MYYCVFWVPCVFQSDLTKRTSAPSAIIARIDDDVTHTSQKVTITFPHTERYDILLTLQNSVVAPLLLHECQTARNGLIKYSFETRNLSGKDIEFWVMALRHPIYHAFKAFFHEHVFHSPDSDAILSAYITEHNVDIFAPNNKALCHYLNDFEQSFIGFSDEILRRRSSAAKILSKKWGTTLLVWKKYPEIEERCNTALGYVLYYNILLASWTPQLRNAETQKRAKGQNAIRTIEHLREENHNTYVRLSNETSHSKRELFNQKVKRLEVAAEQSKIQGNRSIFLGILSFLLGCLSLAIAIVKS